MGAIARKRRAAEVTLGLLLLFHPIPVLLHTIAVTIFALLAAWPRLLIGPLLFVIFAHTAMQMAIATLNDYCDRRADAQSKKRKPIPLGMVRPREALVLGILLVVLMVVLLLPLSRLALLISLLYLALGLAYNLGLKSTPLSGVLFALAIPLIPAYAFVGVGRIIPLVFWLIPVAALLGVALNLANSLPDIEEDSANHANTLAVVLGVRRSLLLCPLLILLSCSAILVLAFTQVVPVQRVVLLLTCVATCLLSGAMLFQSRGEVHVAARKRYFYLVVMTCLILGGGWFIGVLI